MFNFKLFKDFYLFMLNLKYGIQFLKNFTSLYPDIAKYKNIIHITNKTKTRQYENKEYVDTKEQVTNCPCFIFKELQPFVCIFIQCCCFLKVFSSIFLNLIYGEYCRMIGVVCDVLLSIFLCNYIIQFIFFILLYIILYLTSKYLNSIIILFLVKIF